MKITNWKIGARLGFGFAVVLLLLVVVAGLGIGRMAQIQGRLTEISEVNNVELVNRMLPPDIEFAVDRR